MCRDKKLPLILFMKSRVRIVRGGLYQSLSALLNVFDDIMHPEFCGQTLWSDCTAGQMDGETGW